MPCHASALAAVALVPEVPLETLAFGPDHTWCLCYRDDDKQQQRCWSAGLPDGLHSKLSARPNSFPSVRYVALGPDGEWFMSYQDQDWAYAHPSAPKLVDQTYHAEVEAMFFGPRGAYLTLYQDGAVSCKQLPGNMEARVDVAMHEGGGLAWVAMGHNGEWFVQAQDGTSWWCGLQPCLVSILKGDQLGLVERLWLGPNGTYCAQFERSTLWRATHDFTCQMRAWR